MFQSKPITIETLRPLFERYKSETGSYPTVQQIDNTDYLPTSRTLQRLFGGVKQVRILLGHQETDFQKSVTRSIKAVEKTKLSLIQEQEFEKLLIESYGHERVRTAYRIYDDSRSKVDFYVKHQNNPFYVDVFYPQDNGSFHACVSEKLKKYGKSQKPFYVVCLNDSININQLLYRRKNRLPENIKILSVNDFKTMIKRKFHSVVV